MQLYAAEIVNNNDCVQSYTETKQKQAVHSCMQPLLFTAAAA